MEGRVCLGVFSTAQPVLCPRALLVTVSPGLLSFGGPASASSHADLHGSVLQKSHGPRSRDMHSDFHLQRVASETCDAEKGLLTPSLCAFTAGMVQCINLPGVHFYSQGASSTLRLWFLTTDPVTFSKDHESLLLKSSLDGSNIVWLKDHLQEGYSGLTEAARGWGGKPWLGNGKGLSQRQRAGQKGPQANDAQCLFCPGASLHLAELQEGHWDRMNQGGEEGSVVTCHSCLF